MLGCQNRKKPFKLTPGSTTSRDDGKLASSASTQHVSKVAKVGFHVELRSIHIYLCDRSIVNRSSLITASWTSIVWILSQSSSNTIALLVHPIHALRALDRVHTNTTPTDCTGERSRVVKKVKPRSRDHELCLLHVDSQSLAFYTLFPYLQPCNAFFK